MERRSLSLIIFVQGNRFHSRQMSSLYKSEVVVSVQQKKVDKGQTTNSLKETGLKHKKTIKTVLDVACAKVRMKSVVNLHGADLL